MHDQATATLSRARPASTDSAGASEAGSERKPRQPSEYPPGGISSVATRATSRCTVTLLMTLTSTMHASTSSLESGEEVAGLDGGFTALDAARVLASCVLVVPLEGGDVKLLGVESR